jgi:GWxTD domain-containing protein
VKSFWTSCVALELAGLILLAVALPASAAKPRSRRPEDLTNFLLSPEFSRWLVGPISHFASEAEIRDFLELDSDDQAGDFIEQFWERRGGETVFPQKSKRLIFEERAAEADRVFSEGTHRGLRTDRGTVFVLYGPPEEVRYELPTRQLGQPIEVWSYPKDAQKGLDDRKPDRIYRFVREGDLTVFYRGPVRRPRI